MNLSNIMTRAWKLFRRRRAVFSFADALRFSWLVERARMAVTHGFEIATSAGPVYGIGINADIVRAARIEKMRELAKTCRVYGSAEFKI